MFTILHNYLKLYGNNNKTRKFMEISILHNFLRQYGKKLKVVKRRKTKEINKYLF